MTDPPLNYVCTLCAHRQQGPDPCANCGDDSPLDLRKTDTQAFLHDIDSRRRDQWDTRTRTIGVAVGMLVVLALWTQSWWWSFRRHTIGLPLLIDQIAYMVLVALGAMKLMGKLWPFKPRFPFAEDL